MEWQSLSREECIRQLKTDPKRGLTVPQVEQRSREYGQNELREYYVFGNEKTGFGIRIIQRGTVNAEAEYENVSSSEARAMALARTLATGTVCPGHLCNILDDGGF